VIANFPRTGRQVRQASLPVHTTAFAENFERDLLHREHHNPNLAPAQIL
jgi:hypothetical protein